MVGARSPAKGTSNGLSKTERRSSIRQPSSNYRASASTIRQASQSVSGGGVRSRNSERTLQQTRSESPPASGIVPMPGRSLSSWQPAQQSMLPSRRTNFASSHWSLGDDMHSHGLTIDYHRVTHSEFQEYERLINTCNTPRKSNGYSKLKAS